MVRRWRRSWVLFSGDHQHTTDTFQTAASPSPHVRWTSFIWSTALQTPQQDQSKLATQMFPAYVFHSIDGDLGGEVLGDGVDLAGGVAEVLVPFFTELPELG
ncbi:unnamed protein product [Spirodela intermedia]|uniref:Uncharacterized protein n=1 Tax=Spirodela intermedia TaxID=51605 RepID=A0A7I8L3J4_SPIIN|nr:unnamed protein product [Spirodela intermedia]